MARLALFALVCVLLAGPTLVAVHAGKVLLLPLPEDNSHIYLLRRLHDELSERGHTAYMVVPPGDVPRLSAVDKGGNTSHIIYNTTLAKLEEIVAMFNGVDQNKALELAFEHWNAHCDDLLNHADTMARLQADKPDVIVGIPFFACTALLSAKLGIPYISLIPTGLMGNSFMQPLWRGSGRDFHVAPRLASVPEMRFVARHPMTFMQRMQNAWAFAAAHLHDYRKIRPMMLDLQSKHDIDLTSAAARRLESLTLVNADMALELPRPLPPALKLVGPIMARPARALPPSLQEFVEGAGSSGVVLISLGTLAKFAKEDMQMIASALNRLPSRTLWKLSQREVEAAGGLQALNLTERVLVSNWVPQNDVLGHPRTRAFLSHCGANGLNEAAYHGVPVVAMPFFGDQPQNAQKAISKGMAVLLPRKGLSAEGVYDAFMRVLTEDGYRAAAVTVSKRIRSRKRTPLQEAADWVEHVLDSDGEPYLQLPDEDMSFFVRNSLDVIAAYLGIGVVILIAGVTAAWWVVGGAYYKLKQLRGWEKKLV